MRLTQVLSALIATVARSHGLSSLQLEILELLAARGQMEVGPIAAHLMIRAATVSDSISALERKRLIVKERSRRDVRAVDTTITTLGQSVLLRSERQFERLERLINGWPEGRREEVVPAVMEVIASLGPGAPRDRMCITCRYFAINCDARADSAEHFCRFFNEPLRAADLRLDCPEHVSHDLA